MHLRAPLAPSGRPVWLLLLVLGGGCTIGSVTRGPVPPDESPSVVGATTAPSAVASGSKTAAAPSAPPFLKPVSLRQLLGEAEEETGLKFQDLVTGIGPSIKMGDEARVHYTGRFVDGKEFDSSRNRGKPLEFTMGKGMVVPGFERGIVGMRTGGVRRITVPPHLGYGERGSPPAIPPNATLVFEVELVEIPIPAEKEAPKDTRPSGPQIGGQ